MSSNFPCCGQFTTNSDAYILQYSYCSGSVETINCNSFSPIFQVQQSIHDRFPLSTIFSLQQSIYDIFPLIFYDIPDSLAHLRQIPNNCLQYSLCDCSFTPNSPIFPVTFPLQWPARDKYRVVLCSGTRGSNPRLHRIYKSMYPRTSDFLRALLYLII